MVHKIYIRYYRSLMQYYRKCSEQISQIHWTNTTTKMLHACYASCCYMLSLLYKSKVDQWHLKFNIISSFLTVPPFGRPQSAGGTQDSRWVAAHNYYWGGPQCPLSSDASDNHWGRAGQRGHMSAGVSEYREKQRNSFFNQDRPSTYVWQSKLLHTKHPYFRKFENI